MGLMCAAVRNADDETVLVLKLPKQPGGAARSTAAADLIVRWVAPGPAVITSGGGDDLADAASGS